VLKPKLSDASVQDARRRWWAHEADVNQLADEYDLSDLYVELVLRRLLWDGPSFVPGERPLRPDESPSTVRTATSTPSDTRRLY
jgi:hypothetical protein